MKKYRYIVGFIIIISTIAIFSYFFFTRKTNKDVAKQDNNSNSQNLTPTSLPTGNNAQDIAVPSALPEGYIKYQNDKYSFYFYHSPQAKITEYDQGQGATIITLENESKVKGMQIFIVPYWENTISEERFKADVPSKVRTNIKKTFVDDVEAVTFNSVDKNLGETYEIWFIRGGYLYEVTTFRGEGDWFIPEIQSWGFI